MSSVWTLARRELRAYFDAPVAYIVLVAFLAVAGWMVWSSLFLAGRAEMRVLFSPGLFSPAMLLVVIVPALTMRLLAEERRSGTIEFLSTLPITDWQIVLGKFIAAVVVLSVALLFTVAYPISVAAMGDLDWGPVLGGYLGMWLFAASLAAIGLACSALTSNQIVAFIIAFMISATLYLLHWLLFFLPPGLAAVGDFISISTHLQNLARGVIDSRDVLYYLTLSAGALVIAQRALADQHA